MFLHRFRVALAMTLAVSVGATIASASGMIDQMGSDIDGEATNDYFGNSVSMSSDGTVLAVGAWANNFRAGHVRIFGWTGTAWAQMGDDIDAEAQSDFSGYSVSLSADGTHVAIGAPGNDENGDAAGHVRVYQYDGTAGDADNINGWTKVGSDIDGGASGDEFGASVSMSADGTHVAIGAVSVGGIGNLTGYVSIYQYDGINGWTQVGSDIDGGVGGNYSGYSVSMSSDGTILAVGAWGSDGNGVDAGRVRVYQYDGINGWTQVGSDIDGEAANDYSGTSVSMSADGTQVAIGAPGNESNAGQVRVFQFDGVNGDADNINGWTQVGSDIDGQATNDYSGAAVALSSDGTRVAIGAHGLGSQTGYVRVYSITTLLNITYDSQNGSTVSDGDTTTATGGIIGTLPTDPTRDGHTFAGWFTASSGGTEITTGATHNQIADFTLYAQWTANPSTTTTTQPPTTTSTVDPTTTEAPTTTVSATTTVVLPSTGTSNGALNPVLLVLGVGGLLALIARRRVDAR